MPGKKGNSRNREDRTTVLQRNAILQSLDHRIGDVGELVELATRHIVYRADEPIHDVYYPIDSVLSVVTQMKNGEAIEIGTIGREGTSGLPLLMGAKVTSNDCYCQVPGGAIKMHGEQFRLLVASNSSFRTVLDRYLQAYMNFLGQLTACNRLHSVYERCARWLLLTHDRVGVNAIRLTHEYLAMMLGSRRSGVSIALATLQRAGYISYRHGCITITDRRGLEETTCECYAIARKQFPDLIHRPSSDGK